MSDSDRSRIGDAMLFAADDLVDPVPNGPTGARATALFWEAFAPFAAEYLTGSFSMTTNRNTGEISITFRP